MSYTRDRDEFISRMSRDGMPLDVITKLLRYASTLQRLAVAQCNGDWPADNGERKTKVCPNCEGLWAPVSFARGVCPDCRTEALVRAALGVVKTADGDTVAVRTEGRPAWQPVFGGDPRGAVLRLVPAGTSREDIDSGRERGIYVPARER
jgi:hypothetical protein